MLAAEYLVRSMPAISVERELVAVAVVFSFKLTVAVVSDVLAASTAACVALPVL